MRSAIINSGYEYPAKKITINLAPADLPKEGGRYDLPIAIALLAASEQLTANKLDEYELVGDWRLQALCVAFPAQSPVQLKLLSRAEKLSSRKITKMKWG